MDPHNTYANYYAAVTLNDVPYYSIVRACVLNYGTRQVVGSRDERSANYCTYSHMYVSLYKAALSFKH